MSDDYMGLFEIGEVRNFQDDPTKSGRVKKIGRAHV